MKPSDARTTGDETRIERRSLLKGLAAGLAGSLAPTEVSALPESALDQASATTPPARAPELPRLLDDHQRRTLSSLADLLVPGSVAAGVVDLMDRVAAIDTTTGQRRLLNAIARFDQEAQSAHGRPWNDLDETARLAILRGASLSATPADAKPAGAAGLSAPAALTAQFEYLRNTVATTYFRTEAGMTERGWTGRTAWTGLPGCPHPPSAHE